MPRGARAKKPETKAASKKPPKKFHGKPTSKNTAPPSSSTDLGDFVDLSRYNKEAKLANLVCDTCLEKGHVARFCPNKAKIHKKLRQNSSALYSDLTLSHDSAVKSNIQFPWQAKTYSDNVILALDQEIRDFVRFVMPDQRFDAARNDILAHITPTITKEYPFLRVKTFGSFKTALYSMYSDMDLVLLPRKSKSHLRPNLQSIASLLAASARYRITQVIINTKVPIIKLIDLHSKVPIDICYNHPNGPKAAKIIRKYVLRFQPIAYYLNIVIKHFLVQRNLNEPYTGGLGSYGLIILIINFLQLHPRINYLDMRYQILMSLRPKFFPSAESLQRDLPSDMDDLDFSAYSLDKLKPYKPNPHRSESCQDSDTDSDGDTDTDTDTDADTDADVATGSISRMARNPSGIGDSPKRRPSPKDIEWEIAANKEILRRTNLGVLLLEFFELYGMQLNINQVGISLVNKGRYVKARQVYDYRNPGPKLNIIDPQDRLNDVGSKCFGIVKVRSAFQHAFFILSTSAQQNNLGHHATPLSLILNVPETIKVISEHRQLNLKYGTPQPPTSDNSHFLPNS